MYGNTKHLVVATADGKSLPCSSAASIHTARLRSTVLAAPKAANICSKLGRSIAY